MSHTDEVRPLTKIPHPWWHWFFTSWLETVTVCSNYDGRKLREEMVMACSKCKTIYRLAPGTDYVEYDTSCTLKPKANP